MSIQQGDSGGSLVSRGDSANSFMVQIGVVSWGIECALAEYPGVYARVTRKYKAVSKLEPKLKLFGRLRSPFFERVQLSGTH